MPFFADLAVVPCMAQHQASLPVQSTTDGPRSFTPTVRHSYATWLSQDRPHSTVECHGPTTGITVREQYP
jgi:hypothetical protein